jgi:hypothetical protein
MRTPRLTACLLVAISTLGTLASAQEKRQLHRLQENVAAASVELTESDLRDIESAASRITVQGARIPRARSAWSTAERENRSPGSCTPYGCGSWRTRTWSTPFRDRQILLQEGRPRPGLFRPRVTDAGPE